MTKPMTSSKTNADTSKVTEIDKGSYNDSLHSPPLNKVDTSQKHTEKNSIGKTLKTKKEQSTIRNSSSLSEIGVGNTTRKIHNSQ